MSPALDNKDSSTSITQTIESLEKRLRYIETKEDIRELLGQFTLRLDATIKSKAEPERKRFAEIHSEDAQFIHPIATIVSGEEIASLAIHGLNAFSDGQHFLGQPKFIELDVEKGEAKVICDAIYSHVWKPRDGYISIDHLKEYTQVGGKYHLSLRRNGSGQWQITRNEMITAWYHGSGAVL